MDHKVLTKLDYRQREEAKGDEKQSKLNERDKEYKSGNEGKCKKAEYTSPQTFHRRLNTTQTKQSEYSMWTSPYEPKYYIVHKIKGSSSTI